MILMNDSILSSSQLFGRFLNFWPSVKRRNGPQPWYQSFWTHQLAWYARACLYLLCLCPHCLCPCSQRPWPHQTPAWPSVSVSWASGVSPSCSSNTSVCPGCYRTPRATCLPLSYVPPSSSASPLSSLLLTMLANVSTLLDPWAGIFSPYHTASITCEICTAYGWVCSP